MKAILLAIQTLGNNSVKINIRMTFLKKVRIFIFTLFLFFFWKFFFLENFFFFFEIYFFVKTTVLTQYTLFSNVLKQFSDEKACILNE